MNTFVVNIVTPEGTVYEHEGTFLVVKTLSGSMGVLPNHAPLIAPLEIDAVRIDKTDETSDWIAVNGGIIEIRDNVVTILANSAETVDDIDLSRAEQAKIRAQAEIEKYKDSGQENELSRAEVALHRALNRINVANKKR